MINQTPQTCAEPSRHKLHTCTCFIKIDGHMHWELSDKPIEMLVEVGCGHFIRCQRKASCSCYTFWCTDHPNIIIETSLALASASCSGMTSSVATSCCYYCQHGCYYQLNLIYKRKTNDEHIVPPSIELKGQCVSLIIKQYWCPYYVMMTSIARVPYLFKLNSSWQDEHVVFHTCMHLSKYNPCQTSFVAVIVCKATSSWISCFSFQKFQ